MRHPGRGQSSPDLSGNCDRLLHPVSPAPKAGAHKREVVTPRQRPPVHGGSGNANTPAVSMMTIWGPRLHEWPFSLLRGCTMLTMVKDKRSALLRDQIQELKEEASALADRAKKTTRQAEILAERIKDLEKQLAKRS
jgi:hypothetical protein